MSQNNLQFRFSQCENESEDLSQVQSVSDESSQLNESSVLRHESSQNSDDSQQEFERSEFERVISSSPRSSQNFIPTSPQNEISEQLSRIESQNSAENGENPPTFPTNINIIDSAEHGTNLDDFNQSEPVLNGPSGPDTISSQSSADE